jgi:hypothetical protein
VHVACVWEFPTEDGTDLPRLIPAITFFDPVIRRTDRKFHDVRGVNLDEERRVDDGQSPTKWTHSSVSARSPGIGDATVQQQTARQGWGRCAIARQCRQALTYLPLAGRGND